MRRSLALVVLPLVLLLPLSLAACGEDDTATSGPSAAASGDLVTPPSNPSGDLQSAQADVESLAVQLESYYRGGDYPQDLDDLLGTLADAGVAPTGENVMAGYVSDPDTFEFTLCVETPSGAWATYDTEPMSLRQGAESGGCPDLG